ncbi:MAG: monofunctional biosynthetic peptidoglycan transglycosylase, partial [Pseudomonadota bacterium]
ELLAPEPPPPPPPATPVQAHATPSAPVTTTTSAALPHKPPAKPRSRVRRALSLFIKLAACVTLLFATTLIAYRWVNPPTTTLIAWQTLTGTPVRQRWVPIERISRPLIAAVVIAEDAKFCQHSGVDWVRLRAAYRDWQSGKDKGGASTISMQVAKNLWLWPSRHAARKAIEVPLALAADQVWPKRRMLEIYLNIVELGPGIFGVEAASRHYFGKRASQVNWREAALLAKALPLPLRRNPAAPSAWLSKQAGVVVRQRHLAGVTTRCAQR